MARCENASASFTSFANVVAGELRDSPVQYHGINPSTKEQLWNVPVAAEKDVEDALLAAKRAFPAWSNTSLAQRRLCLKQFKDVVNGHRRNFVELLSAEGGKPQALAEMEINIALEYFDYHVCLEIVPEKHEVVAGKTITTRYLPLGTVAAICPWNLPVVLALGKILPALLTCNCVVVKPSPFTPYTCLKLVELARHIFPAGVLQVIGGDDSLGPALVAHRDVHKISFTDSTAAGKKIMAEAAGTLKHVTLELGGNDPAIILPDVNISKVAPKVVTGAFLNSGQMCVAIKRVYIHESIYDPFVQAMVEAVRLLRVGDSANTRTTLGPLQNQMQYERVKAFIEDSKRHGHRFATGPFPADGLREGNEGFFIPPCLVDNPPDDSQIVTEEAFGPILPILKWSTEAEVIRRTNNSNTGLGGSVWSANAEHAERIARQLEVGSVWINSVETPIPQAYFSGRKESGIGGEWGPDGWKAYCAVQVIHVLKAKI